MRLFINKHYFLSIIKETITWNCQVMELIHGMGMVPATIDEDQKDVVSSVVHGVFERESLITPKMEEVFDFHKELLSQLK